MGRENFNVLNGFEQAGGTNNNDNRFVLRGTAIQSETGVADFNGVVNSNADFNVNGNFKISQNSMFISEGLPGTGEGAVVLSMARMFKTFMGAMTTGVTRIDGVLSNTVKKLTSNTISVLGGEGQIVVRNPSTGIFEDIVYISWDAISSLPVTVDNGIFIITVTNVGGVGVVNIESSGFNRLPFDEMGTKLLLGAGSIANNSIIALNPAIIWCEGIGETMHRLLAALGTNNSKTDPILVTFKTGTLQPVIGTGTEQTNAIGFHRNPLLPNFVVVSAPIDPTFVVRGLQIGNIILSPTVALDPNFYEANDFVVSFEASPLGAGFTRVNAPSHGNINGASVSIVDTINYNGRFTISDAQPGYFSIPKPFVGNDAMGTWAGIQAVPNNRFSVQRILALPVSQVIGSYLGTKTYSSLAEVETTFLSTEIFVEKGLTTTALRSFSLAMVFGTTNTEDPATTRKLPFNEAT